MNRFKTITKTLCALAAAVIIVAGGADGCDEKVKVAKCEELNNDSERCNKAEQNDGKKCSYDETAKKCIVKPEVPPPVDCSTMNAKEDDCKDSIDCTWDGAEATNKCKDAATKGLCENIERDTACNAPTAKDKDGKKCEWNTANSKCEVKPGQRTAKNVKVYTITKIPATAIANARVDRVVVSGDEKTAYFFSNTNATLSVLDVDGAANLAANVAKPANWTPALGLSPGTVAGGTFAGATAGKAKLTDANKIIDAQKTQKGMVMTTESGTPKANMGFSYLEGKTYKAAFANDGATAKDILDLVGSTDTNQIYGGMLRRDDGSEYVYGFGTAGGNKYKGATTDAKNLLANPMEKLNKAIVRTTSDFESADVPPIHYTYGKDSAGTHHGFLIDQLGITVIPDGDIGTEQNTLAERKINDPKVGSDAWIVSGKVAKNIKIKKVVFSKGKVKIGLEAVDGNTGGVASYDPAGAGAVVAPDAAWAGISIVDLDVDKNGNLWALTGVHAAPTEGTQIVEVADDTTFDATKALTKAVIDAQQFTNDYSKETDGAMRFSGNIPKFNKASSFEWVGDHLIITTINEGAYVVTFKAETLN